jgi:type II secretory pathway component PulK
MELKRVDTSLVDEAVDQIIDWIDLDSDPRAFGLEDYYYSGPLNTPKEYTGKRLFYSLNELKSLPAIRSIGWNIFDDNFCTHPESKNFSININSLDLKHAYLFSSLFEDLALSDSEYIITNLPEEGVKSLGELSKLFPSYEFIVVNGTINFSTNAFNLITRIQFDDYNSESISSIYYDNNNSYIFSRIYNGI